MATLKSRLEALELTSSINPINTETIRLREWSDAFGQCYETFRASLPSDSFRDEYGRQVDYRNYISHETKREALAKRIKAGEITKDDQQVLDALPIDALARMEMSAADLVLLIQEIDDEL